MCQSRFSRERKLLTSPSRISQTLTRRTCGLPYGGGGGATGRRNNHERDPKAEIPVLLTQRDAAPTEYSHAFSSSLPSCLRSLGTFPSLPGSRLTIFYRDASSALLQLVNQWLNLLPHVLMPSVTEERTQILLLTRIELTTSALAGAQVTYLTTRASFLKTRSRQKLHDTRC